MKAHPKTSTHVHIVHELYSGVEAFTRYLSTELCNVAHKAQRIAFGFKESEFYGRILWFLEFSTISAETSK